MPAARTKGRQFAAKNCDVAFIACNRTIRAEIKGRSIPTARLRDEYGREIQVWTNAYIVQGETEKEAEGFYNHYVHEQGDWEAARIWSPRSASIARRSRPGVEQQLKEHFIAGWGGFPLVGTKEQVVDGLLLLTKAGLTASSCRGRAISTRCANSRTTPIRCGPGGAALTWRTECH